MNEPIQTEQDAEARALQDIAVLLLEALDRQIANPSGAETPTMIANGATYSREAARRKAITDPAQKKEDARWA